MYKIILKTAVTALVLFSATVTIGSEIPGVTSSAYKESSAYPADDSAVITGDALISTAMKVFKDTTVYRDRYGNKTGSAVTDRTGRTTIRDRYGNKVGTATTDSRGRSVIRDRYGNKVGTVESDRRGKVTVRDRYGRKTAESR